ncbi:hypothetical protein [Bradyrhizobium valentinum]|nr:hypothetical protein [Bradyrhizobium valentinum]
MGTLATIRRNALARLEALRPWAREIALMSGKKVRLVRLTTREVVEEIGG